MMSVKHDVITSIVGFFIAVALVVWAPVQAEAQIPDTDSTPLIQVMEHEELGAYLADGDGMSLYLFERDTTQTSTCYDACADAWPPLLTDEAPDAGTRVNTELLGTITREDGATQVTYNGWPLYYFGFDQKAGDIEGQDIEDYGAEWYLISPEGAKVEGEDHASEE